MANPISDLKTYERYSQQHMGEQEKIKHKKPQLRNTVLGISKRLSLGDGICLPNSESNRPTLTLTELR